MEHILITSTANSRIKEAVRIRERKHSGTENLFFIEGSKIARMALAAGADIREVFYDDRLSSSKEGRQLLRLLSQKTSSLHRVTDHVLQKLSDTEAPQGLAAVVSYPMRSADTLPLPSSPLCVVLDGVRDPGNTGTIIRTADAAGADVVVLLEDSCDPFSPKVIRATVGSIFNIPLVRAADDQFSAMRQRYETRMIVGAADAGLSIFDADLTGPIAFLFGNEARGVRKTLRDNADLSVKIPLFGKAESLNVATAAAICLYEAVRQRRENRKG